MKDSEWDGEPITKHHSHLPVEELDPVYRFETLKTDFSIDCLELNGLLVLVEFYIPLFLIARVSLSVWTPISHAQS